MKELLELHGQRRSIREIARALQVSRNTVRKYLRTPGLPTAKPRPRRPSKLDPLKNHVRARLAGGVENCSVLLRELRARGYTGGYSILKDYVRPLRFGRAVKATAQFEARAAEQAPPATSRPHFAGALSRFIQIATAHLTPPRFTSS